jgi:WD40 repeat protein
VTRESRRTLTQRALDAVFGYDFFISYTRRDGGKDYALALARRLEKEGFQIFFDSDDYAMGDDWKTMGKWALHRTSQLVLVASPEALSSSAVVREVEIYSTLRNKRIIPIDFGGTVRHRDETKPVFQHLKPEILFIEEHPDCLFSSTQPSDFVIQKLRDGLHLKRQDKKRARFFSIIAAVLVVLTLFATAAAVYASKKQQEAVQKAKEVQRSLSLSHFISAGESLRHGKDDMALAYLARAVQDDAENQAAGTRLAMLLCQRTWPIPLRIFPATTRRDTSPVRSILLHPDGRRLITESGQWKTSSVQVRDWQTGTLLASPREVTSTSLLDMQLSQDGSSFVMAHEMKGRLFTTFSPVPPLAEHPVWSFNPDQESDEVTFHALAPSGTWVLVSGQGRLTLRPRAATPAQPAFAITFGKDPPPGSTDPDSPPPSPPHTVIAHLPLIESVIAAGCSDHAVFILGNDGALWKVHIPATADAAAPQAAADPQRLATLVSERGAAPAHAAFSHQGDRLAVLFDPDSVDQQVIDLQIIDLATARVAAQANDYWAWEHLKLNDPETRKRFDISFSFLPNDVGVALYTMPNEGTLADADGAPADSELKKAALPRGGWWDLTGTATRAASESTAAAAPPDDRKNLTWHALAPGAVLASDTRFVVAQDGPFARMLDALSGVRISGPMRHEGRVTAATLFKDTLLATGTDEGEVRLSTLIRPSLTPPPTPQQQQQRPDSSGTAQTAPISSSPPSPDGLLLTIDGRQRRVQISKADTPAAVQTSLFHLNVCYAGWHPQHPQQILTIAEGESLRLWDLKNAAIIHEASWSYQLPVYASSHPDSAEKRTCTAIWDPTGTHFMLRSGIAPDFYLTLYDAATLEQLSDPVLAPHLPPEATFAAALTLLPWQKLDETPPADALLLLAQAAEFIAGQHISKEGALETISDLPAALAQLTSAHTTAHPFTTLVQQLTTSPALAELRHTTLVDMAAETATVQAFFDLENAVNRAEEVSSYPGQPRNLWVLSRERREALALALAQARKASPQIAEPLISELYASWRQRTDPLAVLSRWYFQRAPADLPAARALFAQEIAKAFSDPETLPEFKPTLLELQKAWEADLK